MYARSLLGDFEFLSHIVTILKKGNILNSDLVLIYAFLDMNANELIGSSHSILEQIRLALFDTCFSRAIFNQSFFSKYSDDTLSTAWDSILRELVPSIIELKRVMSRIVKGNPFTCASWVMPDGAVAQYASVETLDKPLHWVSSTLHTHTHTHHRKELVPNAKAAGLLPRMIHSLDAYVMRQLVIRAKRLGITIVPNHDSFMFDDSHTHTIFSLIHTLFIEIMDSHSFKHIVDQFNSSKVREDGQYLDRELLTHSDILASVPMKLEDM